MTVELAHHIKEQFGSPVYVYDESTLLQQAKGTLSFPSCFGLTVRFAMKACPNSNILRLFHQAGLHFDASSGFEVRRAIMAGIPPEKISLSSQELPQDFDELIKLGIQFNACSLHQLESFGRRFPGSECGVRFNPGQGSGGTGKTVSPIFTQCVCHFQKYLFLLLERWGPYGFIWNMA
jgi:diaminopimelate decarboxylase